MNPGTIASMASLISVAMGFISMGRTLFYYRKNLVVRDDISRILTDLDARIKATDQVASTAMAFTAQNNGLI